MSEARDRAVDVLRSLTSEDLREVMAVGLSDLIPPGSRLGTELFNAAGSHLVLTAMEIVCIKRGEDGIVRVHLVRRPKGVAYGDKLHVGGSYRRTTDLFPQMVADRVADELGSPGCLKLMSNKPVAELDNPEERFGVIHQRVYLAEAISEPANGIWVTMVELAAMSDEEVVAQHRDELIPMAVRIWQEMQMEATLSGRFLGIIVDDAQDSPATIRRPNAYQFADLQTARALLLRITAPGGPLGPEIWDEEE